MTEQQVAVVPVRNDSTLWIVIKPNGTTAGWDSDDPIDLVRNGDYVILDHGLSRKSLQAYNESAPVTVKHYQLAAGGKVRFDLNFLLLQDRRFASYTENKIF